MVDLWTVGSIVMAVASGGFGIAKGFHDKKVARQQQKDDITKAVADYMANQNQMLSKKND